MQLRLVSMLKVCFWAKQVDSLTASCQILTSKKDSIKPPKNSLQCFALTIAMHCDWMRSTETMVSNFNVMACYAVHMGQVSFISFPFMQNLLYGAWVYYDLPFYCISYRAWAVSLEALAVLVPWCLWPKTCEKRHGRFRN
jgi:hypothetical protein